jgi:hypothetical protein
LYSTQCEMRVEKYSIQCGKYFHTVWKKCGIALGFSTSC